MPEYRNDPFTGKIVIVAEERATRPIEFVASVRSNAAVDCPFCGGNEAETPTALQTFCQESTAQCPSTNAWDVRVVPNKYPAVLTKQLSRDGSGETCRSAPFDTSSYECQPAIGVHEVIIESPTHVDSIAPLDTAQVRLIFQAYQDRINAARAMPEMQYGLIFKNTRAEAGASIEHVHSQFIALPFVPSDVQGQLDRYRVHRSQTGINLLPSVLKKEIADSRRIVTQSEQCIAWCPFASRFPYETWIAPKHRGAMFETTDQAVRDDVAEMTQKVIRALENVLPEPAYNLLVRSAPFDNSANDYYDWHVEFYPRIGKAAGFEWGTGCFINPVSPEHAATELRKHC